MLASTRSHLRVLSTKLDAIRPPDFTRAAEYAAREGKLRRAKLNQGDPLLALAAPTVQRTSPG